MIRVLDRLTPLLVVVALSTIGVGLIMASEGGRKPSGAGLGVTVDASTKDFGTAKVGETVSVNFLLTNRTDAPVRIVGSQQSCVRGGCVDARGLPVVIPARQAGEVRLAFKVISPCRYDGKVLLYTDCPDSPRVALGIVGTLERPEPPEPSQDTDSAPRTGGGIGD